MANILFNIGPPDPRAAAACVSGATKLNGIQVKQIAAGCAVSCVGSG
jgi:hypothetical protein